MFCQCLDWGEQPNTPNTVTNNISMIIRIRTVIKGLLYYGDIVELRYGDVVSCENVTTYPQTLMKNLKMVFRVSISFSTRQDSRRIGRYAVPYLSKIITLF